MWRILTMVAIVATLGFGATPARADHDRALRYALGGALIGVAIGELTQRDRHYAPPVVYVPAPTAIVRYDMDRRSYGRHRAFGDRHRGHCDLPRHRRFARHWH